MKIEVLGCYGNVTRRCRTTSFLVNDEVLFDAGTVTEVLSTERLRRISHVCLSHIHLDHIKGLCSLAEERSMSEFQGITVAADELVIKGLSTHVFNNLLWPDFSSIPDREKAVIHYQVLDGHYTTVAGLRVKPVPVEHRVHTTGFIIQENGKSIMRTSDTGTTEQFWHTARLERPVLIIAHVAFPSRLAGWALTSGHMTPSMLLELIDAHDLGEVPFYIAHMKSMFEREIRHEIQYAGRPNLRVLKQGSVLVA